MLSKRLFAELERVVVFCSLYQWRCQDTPGSPLNKQSDVIMKTWPACEQDNNEVCVAAAEESDDGETFKKRHRKL